MPTISISDLEDYRRVDEILSQRVQKDLIALMKPLRGASPDVIKTAMVEMMPALIDKYGTAAAGYAAMFFENCTGLDAVIPDLYEPEAWEINTKWALNPLFDPSRYTDPLRATFVNLLSVADRQVKGHARHTIAQSAGKYDDVKYARVTTGLKDCSFCMIMASRGPVYESTTTAGGDDGSRYHTGCDCIAVPMRGTWVADRSRLRGWRWDGDTIAGYDFDEIYRVHYLPYKKIALEGVIKEDPSATVVYLSQIIATRDKLERERLRREKAQLAAYNRRGGSRDQPTLQKTVWREWRDSADERYENLAMDQWASAKPVPRIYQQVPIAWPDDLPRLSTYQWNHILYGFGKERAGGHLSGYGWVAGGTEFNRDLTPRDIATMLQDALRKQKTLPVGKPIPTTIDGVDYKIVLKKKKGVVYVSTFHPVDKNRK